MNTQADPTVIKCPIRSICRRPHFHDEPGNRCSLGRICKLEHFHSVIDNDRDAVALGQISESEFRARWDEGSGIF